MSDNTNKGELLQKIEQLTTERNELAATVEALRSAIMSNCYDDLSTSGQRLMELANKTPEQHLHDVRAEAGRKAHFDGYMLGYEHAMTNKEKCEPAVYAEQYAYRVKAGKL